MTVILYPTRGGDPSFRNQDRVIELAREREAVLLLLYVSNVSFLDRFAPRISVELVEAELDEMGEFLLAMAQERVEKAGLKATTAVRHGRFRPALKEIIQEYGVTTVVLGQPEQDTAITTHEYISQVAQFLVDETQVEVIVVERGEIVDSYAPNSREEGLSEDETGSNR